MRAPLTRLLATAALVAVALAILRPDRAAPVAVPVATVSDGAFTHSNSRDGTSVLEHPNLGPGHTVDGTVTIVNSGTLGGNFSLSVDGVADATGPGGGPLSERLELHVRDLQGQAAGYDGDPRALGSLPLGHFSPGESHTYAIALSFPHGATDNDYAASSVGMRFVWSAVAGDPPNDLGSPPGAGRSAEPAAGADRPSRALRLSVNAPRVQRFMQRRRLLVRAWCNRPCRIATRGTVRVGSRTAPLRTRLTRVPRVGVVRPRVRLPRGLRREAQLLLRRGGAIVYKLAVSARDEHAQRVVVERRAVVRARDGGRSARIAMHPIGASR